MYTKVSRWIKWQNGTKAENGNRNPFRFEIQPYSTETSNQIRQENKRGKSERERERERDKEKKNANHKGNIQDWQTTNKQREETQKKQRRQQQALINTQTDLRIDMATDVNVYMTTYSSYTWLTKTQQ